MNKASSILLVLVIILSVTTTYFATKEYYLNKDNTDGVTQVETDDKDQNDLFIYEPKEKPEARDFNGNKITELPIASKSVLEDNPDEFLRFLDKIKGEDPESFNNGACIYLSGGDTDIEKWQDFSDEKRSNLADLYNSYPYTKLDYSNNPNNVSDRVLVGPLCDCDSYNNAVDDINQFKLQFDGKLVHTNPDGSINEDITECA